ncbi:MAG: PHP domain-containing protein [Gemmatimonadetes bacterium]|nr:PHP domain-containing protein [Gemmatimonadota bacterium]
MTASAAADERFVDLHMHSTASDGALAPTLVVEAAAKARLALICLTDHDTVGGVAEAQAAGAGLGVEVAAGCELSAHDGEKEVHLLGLHLERLEVIEGRMAEFRSGRERRGAAIVEALNANGVALTLEAVEKECGGGAMGRPHVARALIAGGFVRDTREAFDRWLGAGRPAYVDKERLEVDDAIAIVHAAGGIAVFAHPGKDADRSRIERFVAHGLDGLEVRHPSHTADETARLEGYCGEFGLVMSGGSDWHGMPGARVLGQMNVPYAWADAQRQRAARYRGPVA